MTSSRSVPRWAPGPAAAVAALLLALAGTAAPSAAAAAPAAPLAAATAAAPRALAPLGASVPQQVVVGGSGHTLSVPPGFTIGVYASVAGARFLTTAPDGSLLVSQPGYGSITRLAPGSAAAGTVLSGLNQPQGMVFASFGGVTYLYVSQSDRVERWVYGNGALSGRQLVVGGLPSASNTAELHGAYAHALKNIAISGGTLYVSVASATNADPSLDIDVPFRRAAIYSYPATGLNQAGSAGHLYAQGLRNAEGLAVLPGTSTLWVDVNNRDNIACPGDRPVAGCPVGAVLQGYVDNHPPEEFTSVRDGGNYGWPFCNPNPDAGLDAMSFQRDQQNNAAGNRLDCDASHGQVTTVDKGIQAHSAPLGLTFTQASALPGAYRTGALIALHGSWNRTVGTGAKVVYFPFDAVTGQPGDQVDLVTGWQDGPTHYWGRPVDTAVDAGGSIFVTDDSTGTVYRVTPSAATPALVTKAQQDAAVLGAPISTEYSVPGGRVEEFVGGRVYWGPSTGAHAVHGDILGRYLSLSASAGFLGLPVTSETATPDGVGRYNVFQGGWIYWSPATGAFEVHGAIRDDWARLGSERSPLGYPLTNELLTPDGAGHYNHFQGGSVYWTPATGAHEVHGSIFATWASLGWEHSRLGYPVSDEYAVPGGRRSDFQGGSVSWDSATGRTTVTYR